MADSRNVAARSIGRLDVVHYNPGGFSWTGLVAASGAAHLLLMDEDGRLCRAPRYDDATVCASGASTVVTRLRRRTEQLFDRTAVREAVAVAASAPFDPAGYDIWNLPLRDLTAHGRPLKPALHRYLGWDAYTRRCFEEVLAMMLDDEEAYAQHEAYWQTVLGPYTSREICGDRTMAAIRMSRMRSHRFIRRYMGSAVLEHLDESCIA